MYTDKPNAEWFLCFFVLISGASLTLVQLLLTQLMLVDQQRHGDAVLEQILQVLGAASAPARQLIVNSLEDIVDITLHDRLIVKIL